MKFLVLISALFLNACAEGNYKNYLRMYDIPPPTIKEFTHCYDYGCKTKTLISLPNKTKNKLRKIFKNKSDTAEKERQKISTAIQIFEKDIGNITNTENDKRGTFRLYQDKAETTKTFQQDCIDESTNTTIYIALLEELELLQFHRVSFPASRQPFLSGAPWWHQTAVIVNIETNEKYAVDSWFKDNGSPAYIVPYKEWKAGWLPSKPKADKDLKGNID